ncbi:MAG: hypothetical protein UY47_C0007G0036 [Parcubacteria group bacterium GW2011_GWB1_49_7]|nr:MAG: hypothetical protein UX71_C0002G0153 [Parcubacteria group bacterium GW2011_GWA1_47_10]KKW09695.1 MAG: hypothetical protein UY47_C0007G0036 [Parcubacteria group bacterium GW2011_GWB1_49_7]
MPQYQLFFTAASDFAARQIVGEVEGIGGVVHMERVADRPLTLLEIEEIIQKQREEVAK